jgi:hypothetical protein
MAVTTPHHVSVTQSFVEKKSKVLYHRDNYEIYSIGGLDK